MGALLEIAAIPLKGAPWQFEVVGSHRCCSWPPLDGIWSTLLGCAGGVVRSRRLCGRGLLCEVHCFPSPVSLLAALQAAPSAATRCSTFGGSPRLAGPCSSCGMPFLLAFSWVWGRCLSCVCWCFRVSPGKGAPLCWRDHFLEDMKSLTTGVGLATFCRKDHRKRSGQGSDSKENRCCVCLVSVTDADPRLIAGSFAFSGLRNSSRSFLGSSQ